MYINTYVYICICIHEHIYIYIYIYIVVGIRAYVHAYVALYTHTYAYIYIYVCVCDELISDVLLWTPSYGRACVGRPARTYIQQRSADTKCSQEYLLGAMYDRDEWRGRESGKSMVAAQYDDDDDGDIYIYILLICFYASFVMCQHFSTVFQKSEGKCTSL